MKKLNELLFNQGGKCFYCDSVLDIGEATLDHVVPQSKGGTNDLDNLVVCCKYANHAFKNYSPKHKMGVIKHLCCSVSACKKIFPRETTEHNGTQNILLIENKLEHKPKQNKLEQSKPEQPKPKPEQSGSEQPKPEQLKKQTQSAHVEAANKSQPDISVAYQLLCQAIESLESDGKDAISSHVKTKMLALNSSFKQSDYGFSQFKKFLLHAQEDKIVTLTAHKNSGNYTVKKR